MFRCFRHSFDNHVNLLFNFVCKVPLLFQKRILTKDLYVFLFRLRNRSEIWYYEFWKWYLERNWSRGPNYFQKRFGHQLSFLVSKFHRKNVYMSVLQFQIFKSILSHYFPSEQAICFRSIFKKSPFIDLLRAIYF